MRFQIRPEPGLAFILPLIGMLTKEPEMLQPDAFCEHSLQCSKMRLRLVLPQDRTGELTALPRPQVVLRGPFCGGEREWKKVKDERDREGGEGEERRG